MRRVLASVLLVTPVVFAGETSYFCSITSAHGVDSEGRLVEWSEMTASLKQQQFSVERTTGRITAEFYNNTVPIVVQNPASGEGNAYMAIDLGKSGGAALISSLVINEYVESARKPFIWHWGGHVITGTCE